MTRTWRRFPVARSNTRRNRRLSAFRNFIYFFQSLYTKLKFFVRKAVANAKAKARLRRIHKVRKIKIGLSFVTDVFNSSSDRAATEILREDGDFADFIFFSRSNCRSKKLAPAFIV